MKKWLVFSFQNDNKIPLFRFEGQFKKRKEAHIFAANYEAEYSGERFCVILKCSKMFLINPMTGGLL